MILLLTMLCRMQTSPKNGSAAQDGTTSGTTTPYQDSRPGTPDQDEEERQFPPSAFTTQTISATSYTRQQKIKIASKQLLTVQEPSFDFDASHGKLKATWLGHAGVLLQLPPLNAGEQPIRVLFDPIFSQRCSPTQVAGPIRSYAAPCPVASLPPIDIVIISHNHYDHLDYDTIKDLWAANKNRIRFVVPLGNKDWFVGAGAGAGAGSSRGRSTVGQCFHHHTFFELILNVVVCSIFSHKRCDHVEPGDSGREGYGAGLVG